MPFDERRNSARRLSPPESRAFIDRILERPLIRDQVELLDILATAGSVRVQTVNLHHLALATRHEESAEVLLAADYLTADGWPVRWLFRASGQSTDRVTGSEFVWRLSRGLTNSRRVAIVGASATVGQSWQDKVEAAGVQVCFREHGRYEDWDAELLSDEINRSGADLTLVAATPPRGDVVAHALNLHGLRSPVVSVGGSLEMIAGSTRLAPSIAKSLGAEWLFRLLQEPRRLARRYLLTCTWAMVRHVAPAVVRGYWRQGLGRGRSTS